MAGLNDIKVLLGQIGDIAKEAIGVYQDVSGQTKKPKTQTTTTQQPTNNTYSANLKPSDFAFQPNWSLLAAGVVLLFAALYLLKR